MKKIIKKSLAVVVSVSVLSSCWYVYKRETKPKNRFAMNVEALSARVEEDYPEERASCIASGGNWNMASVCEDAGLQEVICTVSGEASAFGVTIRGSYTKGKAYYIPWARYKCVESKGNCCKKQGLFSGDTKLA